MFRPELKDKVNAIGAALASVGGLGLFGILFGFPTWTAVLSFLLWASGTGILIYHSRTERDK